MRIRRTSLPALAAGRRRLRGRLRRQRGPARRGPRRPGLADRPRGRAARQRQRSDSSSQDSADATADDGTDRRRGTTADGTTTDAVGHDRRHERRHHRARSRADRRHERRHDGPCADRRRHRRPGHGRHGRHVGVLRAERRRLLVAKRAELPIPPLLAADFAHARRSSGGCRAPIPTEPNPVRGSRCSGDRRTGLRPKDPNPPCPGTSTARAHAAHAPLRRLSETALSARAPDELRAALIAEARRALGADAVDVLPAGTSPPAIAHVVGTARSLALDEGRLVAELGAELATALEARSALLVPLAWAGDVHAVAVLARRTAHVWTPDETLIAETLAQPGRARPRPAGLRAAPPDAGRARPGARPRRARAQRLARAPGGPRHARPRGRRRRRRRVRGRLPDRRRRLGRRHRRLQLPRGAGTGCGSRPARASPGQVLATGRAVTTDAYARR